MSQVLVQQTKDRMKKTIETLQKELSVIRTGRASSSILDLVKVEYYGFKTPLVEIATVSTPEPRTIMIKPYEKEALKMIEKAIVDAQLGMMPTNDGVCIRLNVPTLTEERRKELCKKVGKLGEEAKVALRNIRRDINELIKKDKTLREDERKRSEADIQKVTDEYVKSVDTSISNKEKDIMAI